MKKLFVPLFILLASCADQFQEQDLLNADLVHVRNGFLEFRDKAAYDQVGQQLKGKSQEELDTWERSLNGFVSMRSIYNKALTEEENFFMSGGSFGNHSVFVKQNIEKFIIIDDTDLRINLPYTEDIHLPTFVNQFGIVKVGSSIFEYRSKSIKEIRDGDFSKINILNDFTESNKEKNISVINITTKSISIENDTNLKVAFSGNSNCIGYTSGGGQRVKGDITLYNYAMVDVYGTTPFPGQVVYLTEVVTTATNQNKTLGVWVNKKTAELQIIGTVDLSPYGSASTSVNADSGGDQTQSIGAILYSSGWVNTGWNPFVNFSGALTFYGRHGSTCSI